MSPDASYYQFSKEVWQAVNYQARHTLTRKEFCPEQSRVESVRCVDVEEETSTTMVARFGSLKPQVLIQLGESTAFTVHLNSSCNTALWNPLGLL